MTRPAFDVTVDPKAPREEIIQAHLDAGADRETAEVHADLCAAYVDQHADHADCDDCSRTIRFKREAP